jgi:hypothetical protein
VGQRVESTGGKSGLFLDDRVTVIRRTMMKRTEEHSGQTGAFFFRELRGGFVKVALCRGFDAENAVSPFDAVQIQLENPF